MNNTQNKLVICVGVSASGKSTWANSQENFRVICRDDIRGRLFPEEYHQGEYKMTKMKESRVSAEALNEWYIAVDNNQDVIIADTNLNPKYREQWKNRGEDAGYEVEFKYFPIDVSEAIKRDLKRGAYAVGSDVINQQWKMWNKFVGRKRYEPDQSKQKAIIVDVDGTIADKGDRSPFDWSNVGLDTPRKFIIDMVNNYIDCNDMNDNFVDVIFLSGRDSVCRHETLTWISKHLNIHIFNINLFMRKEGDMRKDTVIKEELFWEHIAPHYNVLAAFDDRPCVVDMWHDVGIPNVIAVADQRNKF